MASMQETEGDGEEESRGDRKKKGRKLGRNKRQEEERQGRGKPHGRKGYKNDS